ncbi:MAG: divalent-cation tolerance protein CutA [Candidatus Omnitrophica bacterium]|jgi:periplasmic divalent cation tolerance protein|nr:divalent-cation tolerance protein CutA [Candidatus Omnitrophota bacterium]MDD3274688.1 divalent-cation tolerance protein CutA [Candidatus Omnitrophota bacterium]MDD5077690.1 divalent-cation tolerance protein CutA [Candidatus Omnitrophota bacterium]MDD5724746.1 divalent-cation tolerance protein CutA [Candidatus Omnitrophota bacterium]
MYLVVLVTAKDKKEARKISSGLIEAGLAACINIVGGVESVFFWKNKLNREKETLLIIKTKKERFSRVIKLIRSIHSYEVPEIIALPVVAGDKSYLRWVDANLR